VLPLVFAIAAKEKGHDAVVFLAGDATLLMKDGVAEGTKAAGQPDARALLRKAAALRIPIFL
jgi:predicted peroxiredoxin